ncbi:MAG: PAS domain S-box protein [Spirochaetes bacterium]|nr:PAS domain S-box protein [Spirochaetota bacterium]
MKRLSIIHLILYYTMTVFIIPIIIIGIGSILMFYYYTNNITLTKNQSLAKSITYKISDYIKLSQKSLTTLTKTIENTGSIGSDYSGFILKEIEQFELFTAIQIYNQQYQLVYKYPDDPRWKGFTFPYQPESRSIDEHLQVTPVTVSILTGKPEVSFIQNIFYNDQFSGMIKADLNLKNLRDDIIRFNDEKQGILVLVTDSFGNLIAHPNDKYVTENINIKLDHQYSLFYDNLIRYDNSTFFLSPVSVPTINWNVYVLQEKIKATRPVQIVKVMLIIVLIFGIFIAIVSDYFGIITIFKPLSEISLKTSYITHGNYEVDFGVYKVKEINQLAKNFSRMVNRVCDRENDLKEKEIKYRKLVEDNIDFIFKINREFNFTFVSSAVEKILGYRSEFFTEQYKNVFIRNSHIFPNEQMNIHALQITKDVFRKSHIPPSFYLEVNHKDGYRIILEIQVNPIVKKNQVIEIQGTARDVSSRYVMEQNAIYLKNYLYNIIESMPSSIITFNSEGKINHVNTIAQSIIGLPALEIQGKIIWEVAEYFKKFKKYFEYVIKTKKTFEFKDEYQSEKLGKKFYNITIFPLKNNLDEMVIRIDDISQLESTEIQLRQAQKLKTIGMMSGGLAHDFNNILGGILGTLTLIDHRIKKEQEIDILDLKDDLSTIQEAATKGKNIIRQLMSLARNKNIEHEIFDLNQEINQVVELCNKSFTKLITISVNYYEEPAYIFGAKSQIEQLLLNMMINARDAITGSGKITISLNLVDSTQLQRKNQLKEDRNFWLLTIEDSGEGIDMKHRESIFDPFFSTKEKSKGTGLGLTMVYNIVKNHKGFIDFDSEKGEGTTFYIYLPFEESIEYSILPKNSNEKIIMGKGKVLLIDDEKYIRETTRQMLEECGYQSIIAENGYQAIEIYQNTQQEIDLVVLDVFMPKMTGKTVIEELKKMNSDVKVLLISGIDNDKIVKEANKLVNNHFLLKPFTIQELSFEVNRLLKEK